MGTYILRKKGTNLFVSLPGREKAYTNTLKYAQKFKTKEEAEKNKCGNETIVAIYELGIF